MKRRTYLGSLGVAGLAGVAGCLDTLGMGSDDGRTTLAAAEDHPDDPPYPSHGDEFPSFSIPDPVAGTTVSLEDFVGERPFVLTYIYTSCPDGVCPALLTRLQWIQEDAADRGYADEIGLLAFTFDPENDTADALKDHAEGQHLDYEHEHFHFLRPESNEEADRIMTETFGMPIQRGGDGNETDDGYGDHDENGSDGDHDETDGHAENDSDGDHGDHGGNESDAGHGDHDPITHSSRITLVNEDGIVERAYPKAVQSDMAVSKRELLEDTRRVVGVE